MKFHQMRKLGLPTERTREERRRIRDEGEARRVMNARLTAASERIEERIRRRVQSTIDRYLARAAEAEGRGATNG